MRVFSLLVVLAEVAGKGIPRCYQMWVHTKRSKLEEVLQSVAGNRNSRRHNRPKRKRKPKQVMLGTTQISNPIAFQFHTNERATPALMPETLWGRLWEHCP